MAASVRVRRAAVGLRLLGVVCHAEDDLLQGVGVLAVVAAEEVGILRAERVAHAEDRFAGGFGLRPHRGAGINLGIEVHAGQQAVDRTLVGTRVVRACGRHRAFVRSQVGQLRDAVVEDILARGLFGVHTAAEGRGLGRERHVAEHVEGDPVEIGAQETGLGTEALDPGGQFAAHAAVGEFVRGGLAQVLVHVGDALQRTYVDGVGRVVVGVGPRVGIHGAYPGVVLPGAFAGVGRNLLDRPECADELRGAAVADLQVGGVVRDEIEIEFGEPGQVAVLVFPVDGLRGRVGRVEGQGVEIPDARSEQHRCACRRQGEMFYVDFHGSFVFRSLHSDAANRCAARPDRAVDAVDARYFGVYAAVIGDDEYVLHAEGDAHRALPVANLVERVPEVDVVHAEERSVFEEHVRIPLLAAVGLRKAGLLDQPCEVGQVAGVDVDVGRRVGRGEVVEDPVARRTVAVEAEVPVLVAQLEADAVEEVRVGTLVGHVTVGLRDLAVLVTVDQRVLDRIAVLVVYLLETVESVGRIAYLVDLEQVARALGDASRLDVVVGVVGVVELGELGVLERAVEADREVPVLGLHGDEIQVEFHALVLHRANVGEPPCCRSSSPWG